MKITIGIAIVVLGIVAASLVGHGMSGLTSFAFGMIGGSFIGSGIAELL